MSVSLETLLESLSGVIPSGDGYKALCPSHPDTDGSLCVDRGDNGGILLKCMAGCKNEDIVASLGLELSALCAGPISGVPEIASRTPYEPPDLDYRSRVYGAFLARLELSAEHSEQLIKRGFRQPDIIRNGYKTLTDDSGSVVAAMAADSAMGSEFASIPGFVWSEKRQAWTCSGTAGLMIPVRDPLGRIQGFQIRTGQPGRKYVWLSSEAAKVGTPVHCPMGVDWSRTWSRLRITEGPLKADLSTYFDPTCPCLGIPGVSSSASLMETLSKLSCQEILLAFDSDYSTNSAVRSSMVQLKSTLEAAGYKTQIETWPASAGKGIDDLLFRGGEPTILDNESLAIVEPTLSDGIELVRLSDVKETQVDWIWPGWMAAGTLHLLDGDPGMGKSTLVCDTIARLTTGRTWPGGQAVDPTSVVVLSAEDPIDSIWYPRCRAAGADLSRVFFLNSICVGPGETHLPSFPEDAMSLEQVIRRTHAGLVVIDPLFSYISDKLDANRDQHAKQVMTSFAQLGRRTGAAIQVVRHLSKNNETSALYRGQASIGVVGTVRIAWMMTYDPDSDNKGDRTLSQTKNNITPLQRGYRFTLASEKPYTAGSSPPAKIQWGGKLDNSADEILKRLDIARANSTKGFRHAAESLFFATVLARGPVSAISLIERAKATLGYTPDQTRQARLRLGIRTTKTPNGYEWELPVTIADLKRGLNAGQTAASEGR